MKMFKMTDIELEKMNRKNLQQNALETNGVNDKYYNLKEYASEFFRKDKKTKSSNISLKTGKVVESWAKTMEPIKEPLLARTSDRLQTDAINMFVGILKYCGDFVSRKPDFTTEWTDQIFTQPVRKSDLRDELYCQVRFHYLLSLSKFHF